MMDVKYDIVDLKECIDVREMLELMEMISFNSLG